MTTQEIIEKLEADRGSKVIVYCTGEKSPPQLFATQVALDIIPLVREILETFSANQPKITLVINTSGGMLEAPWPLVNLIREYCKTFEVIVLEKALSAGSLIALGADKIVMMPYSQLSPIDPAADIRDGSNPPKRLEIEDIIGYIDFAKEKVGIKEQSTLAEIMKELTKEVSPTVLGSVNRTHFLVRRLAKELLRLHKNKIPERQVKEIVENLTQNLYSHRHLINRKEAKAIGFENIIEFSKDSTKVLADSLLNSVFTTMQYKEEFNPLKELGQDVEKEIKITRALVYSAGLKYDFNSTYKIMRQPNGQVNVNSIINRWEKI